MRTYAKVMVYIWNHLLQCWGEIPTQEPMFPLSMVRTWFVGNALYSFGPESQSRVSLWHYVDAYNNYSNNPDAIFYRHRKTGKNWKQEVYHFNTPHGLYRIEAYRNRIP